MEKAKRARKAETPRRPSLCLRLRAPYLYPDPSRDRSCRSGCLLPSSNTDNLVDQRSRNCMSPRFVAIEDFHEIFGRAICL
jgi:hypothetical protein